jgi:hypothetical protein
MKPGSIDLDDADTLIASAAILVGDDRGRVLVLLMTAAAQLILDTTPDQQNALRHAHQAGQVLADTMAHLAELRLADSRPGGNA